MRTTGSLGPAGWLPVLPSNQIGALVPQWFLFTFVVGIFPPTKLVKRYHPAVSFLSHSATCPDFHWLCVLRRELSISWWFCFLQQLLQVATCWPEDEYEKARTRIAHVVRKRQRSIFCCSSCWRLIVFKLFPFWLSSLGRGNFCFDIICATQVFYSTYIRFSDAFVWRQSGCWSPGGVLE